MTTDRSPLRDPPSLGVAAARGEVGRLLLASGLSERSELGSVGVEKHLERLDRALVTRAELLSYASRLEQLGEASERAGARAPATFWDVETSEQRRVGWDVYRTAEHLVSSRGAPFPRLLARAHDRFLAFKAGETAGDQTALDAALDLVAIVAERAEADPALGTLWPRRRHRDPVSAALCVWQDLVTVSVRRIPGTRRPLFRHGRLAHLNLPTCYRHLVGRRLPLGEVWGVTGFHSRFVGPAHNDNQVEHLAISLVLQAVWRVPVVVLDAVEWAQVRLAGSHPGEARADRALNWAVREAFVPRFRHDLGAAVEALREKLRAG